MGAFSDHDLKILRERAALQLEYSHSEKNERIMSQWKALAAGRRESPTVRLLFSNYPNEVITPRMRCEGAEARMLENMLLSTLVGRELFDDDTPIAPTFDVYLRYGVKLFGLEPNITHIKDSSGYHINPVIDDLEESLDKLRGGRVMIDLDGTNRLMELADEAFGDILPAKMKMFNLTGAITNPLVHLTGLENFYYSMMDTPDALHAVMDLATGLYEELYDELEAKKLLLPTNGICGISQESFAFTDELPDDNVTRTNQCWGFLESQESVGVSPDMYGEFVYPYQDRLAKRFGLLSYGCCEGVDCLFEKYLSKWEHLRKLSVSPFNDERKVGEYLRGTRIVYYSKPRAEFVTNPGPLDEAALRKYFKYVCECASGCLFEMAQREVGTIFGDSERGRRYVQIAKECIREYWKP